jgi:predicted CXXCH cytochrome family protein
MTNRLNRYVFALMLALVLAASSLIAVNAQTQTPPPTVATTSSDSCATCHQEYYAAWQSGAHSKTRTEHVMQEASNCVACHKNIQNGDMSVQSNTAMPSQSQASSGQSMQANACTQCHVTGYNAATGKWRDDGVACEACHNPIPANHPEQDMPVNKTTDLCRTCHSEARFGWDEWKVSVHFQNNIVCTTCHDSHSTSFKLSTLSDADASVLCQNCHKDVASDAQHSAHSVAGVTCIKCHLGEKKGPDVFHQVPDHSFQPKLETCNACHAQEIHGVSATAVRPVETATVVVEETPTATPAPRVENITPKLPISDTPTPANVISFIGMAAVFGLVGGLIFSIARKR